MYQNPVLFSETSNREDFLRTVSLFDDDTGQAIDVSGRTLAVPGDFVGANWTVSDGNIITHSNTQLTIKDYPFGNEMQAIAAIVGQNLGLLAGDPITFADVNPLNTMTGYVVSYAPATGAVVAQIGCAFDFEIRGNHHGDGYGDGYGSSSQIGSDSFSAPLITALLGTGITVVDIGKLQIRIPASTMQQLRHRTYCAAMAVYSGPDTRQLFIGKLPILYGGLSTAPLALPQTPNPYGLP